MAGANFQSGTVWTGDNLTIMRGMNSACVDLIYLDPPFNSNRNYAAPIGSKAAGAAFKDAWTLDDVDVHEHGELAENNPAAHAVIAAARLSHGKSMMAYLIFMAVRLLEMHRILKPTGSLYLHCDRAASHYLKLLLDATFGPKNVNNEIIWSYKSGGGSRRHFGNKHDTLFWYRKGRDWTFNADSVRVPYDAVIAQKRSHLFHKDGKVMGDVWDIPRPPNHAKERTGYPTQKPLALLDMIIKASSHPGDMVFDPFCGCATTLVAADRLQRHWAGVDLSPRAVELVNTRIAQDREGLGTRWSGAIALDAPPRRSDLGESPHFRYRSDKHFLYGRQEGVCNGCNLPFPFGNLEVDHLPRSEGGTDHLDTLQLLCSACHHSKNGAPHGG
ncbi:MAG: HNH endonuclease [Rhodobacteraceae bacterium]|nr:HNH endonuclease [Paracoccaceae bacterium]